MKNKPVLIAYVLSFLCMLFVGCDITDTNSLKLAEHNEIKSISLDFANVLSYKALVDGSIIYMNADEKTATYYRYYIDDGKIVELAKIDNFVLSTKNSVLFDNKLYFFAGVFLSNDKEPANTLFQIDLSSNTMNKYENFDGSLAGISTYEHNGNIVTLKNIVSDDTITTFLEMFDASTGKWSTTNTNVVNTSTNIGSAIFALFGNQNTLCVMYDECNGQNNVHTTLRFYDEDMREIKALEISQEIKDFVMGSRIIEIAVFGDYVYINNISNKAVLGKITENEIVPILMESNLELALNQTDMANPFFYIRRSNKCYTLDGSGGLNTIELNIESDYSIMFVLADKESIALVCYADDKPNRMYYVNKNSLKSIVIQ